MKYAATDLFKYVITDSINVLFQILSRENQKQFVFQWNKKTEAQHCLILKIILPILLSALLQSIAF